VRGKEKEWGIQRTVKLGVLHCVSCEGIVGEEKKRRKKRFLYEIEKKRGMLVSEKK
jgi:hypothetical protein